MITPTVVRVGSIRVLGCTHSLWLSEKHLLTSVVFDVLAKHDSDTVHIAYGNLANSVGLIGRP